MATESQRDVSIMIAIMASRIIITHPSRTGQEAQELAGKILCLIFDFVKPADYLAAMTAARRKYAGIEGSPQLQAVFADAVERMAHLGWLDSLDAAVQNSAWVGL